MSTQRLNLIQQLEAHRQSKVICYLTSDMQPFGARIAPDVIPIIYRHLRLLGSTKKISLLLSSNGGTLDTPWPLVGLIREYCDKFEVLVPGRALSAATLLALGANRIVMGPGSFLSPIDPRATIDNAGQEQQLEVEDVIGFIDFAKEQLGLRGEEALAETLGYLATRYDPHVLGSINRTYYLIRNLARRMLLLHLNHQKDQARIDLVVDNLVQKLYSHRHLIYRKEATDEIGFGNIIEYADETTQTIMDALYGDYSQLLNIGRAFNPADYFNLQDLQGGQPTYTTINRAVVESINAQDVFLTQLEITLDQDTNEVNISDIGNRWMEVDHE